MQPSASGDITYILKSWQDDRKTAIEQMTLIVCGELRKIAAAYLRRQRPDHALQPTALIHEAYLKLVKQDGATIHDRAHFYALAARMMRQILMDAARARLAEKRGSGNKVALDERMEIGEDPREVDFLALNEALEGFQKHSPRIAQGVCLL